MGWESIEDEGALEQEGSGEGGEEVGRGGKKGTNVAGAVRRVDDARDAVEVNARAVHVVRVFAKWRLPERFGNGRSGSLQRGLLPVAFVADADEEIPRGQSFTALVVISISVEVSESKLLS